MQEVIIYCDGCSLDNPGPGGWAAILVYNGVEKEFVGGELASTNNRAELQAATIGLQALKRGCTVKVVSDSQYVVKGMSEWVAGWQRKGWRTANGDPVKNRELWEALLEAVKPHNVKWEWVKGHAGHHYNERCDVLAKEAALKFKAGVS
ncbi:MAG: rnhA [Cyanobacteria bacterium RYN_339]|nr:rnhA [Cyanobacteria bacterium RYN_339]